MRISTYLVTIKLPRNPDHDPKNKVTGICPVTKSHCTDVTGEHHTFIETGKVVQIEEKYKDYRITRIEDMAAFNM